MFVVARPKRISSQAWLRRTGQQEEQHDYAACNADFRTCNTDFRTCNGDLVDCKEDLVGCILDKDAFSSANWAARSKATTPYEQDVKKKLDVMHGFPVC